MTGYPRLKQKSHRLKRELRASFSTSRIAPIEIRVARADRISWLQSELG
jgi:hypothetical protein